MKKKISFLAAAVLITAVSFAQFNKGDRFFGGSFSASVLDYNNSPGRQTASNTNLIPSYSWMIKNNLALGVKGGIGWSSSRQRNATPEAKSTSLSISPGVFLTRFKTLKDKFGITFTHELSGYYAWQKNSSGGIATTVENSGVSYSFSPGVFYRFTENFLGQASLGGVYASWNGNSGRSGFGLGVSFLQSFNLGIAYRVSKNKSKS